MLLNYPYLKDIVFIDIETVSAEKNFDLLSDQYKKLWIHKANLINPEKSAAQLYFEKAAIYAEFGKIITIGLGFFFENDNGELGFKLKSFSGDVESVLLNDFASLIHRKFKSHQTVFCAHNGKEFDYPYLCRRLLVNGIDIPAILKLNGKKPWEVKHLDTLELWKFGDKKNFTSLELLAALFNIPGSKNEMDGSRVNEFYYIHNQLSVIDNYCKQDVLVTAQLFLRLHNKPLIKTENIEWV